MDISRLALQTELWSLQDTNYQLYSMNLLPEQVKPTVIGVRLPKIRQMAQAIVRTIGPDEKALAQWFKSFNALRNIDSNLRQPDNKEKFFYEERLLCALVIAYAPLPLAQKHKPLKTVVEKMDNWAICDSVINTLTLEEADLKTLKSMIRHWLKQLSQDKITNPYILRFILVTALYHFFPREEYAYMLELSSTIQHPAETVKMAKAWLLSQYVAQMPEEGMAYLRDVSHRDLDLETYALTVRKINDSLRVEDITKDLAKTYLLQRRQEALSLDK